MEPGRCTQGFASATGTKVSALQAMIQLVSIVWGPKGPPYFLLGTRPLLASCFKMFSNYLGFMALCDVPFIAYLFMQAKWLP